MIRRNNWKRELHTLNQNVRCLFEEMLVKPQQGKDGRKVMNEDCEAASMTRG